MFACGMYAHISRFISYKKSYHFICICFKNVMMMMTSDDYDDHNVEYDDNDDDVCESMIFIEECPMSIFSREFK